MPALLRHHVSRFIVTTALAGSLIDWVMFATMVVTVDQLLGSTPWACLLYTSPSPRDGLLSRMPSSA